MKICHLVSTFKPYLGGMGISAHYLAKGLAARGNDLTLVTVRHKREWPEKEAVDGYKIWRLDSRWRKGNSAWLAGLSERLRDFDLIHVHYPFLGAESILSSKLPLILTYHMDLQGRSWQKLAAMIYQRTLMPYWLQRTSRVIFTSEDYFKNSLAYQFLKNQPSKVSFIPWGVTPDFCPKQMPNNELVNILFVGGLDRAHYFKGLHLLIEAISQRAWPKVVLTIVGDGDLRPYYQKMAENFNIRVNFIGRLNHQELIAAYQGCDFLVLPSVDRSEAFGLVLLEAMACGKPVIASDLPGVRYVVGEAGLLVKPGDSRDLSDKIKIMITTDRLKMGDLARKRAQDYFQWPKIIDQVEDLYRQL